MKEVITQTALLQAQGLGKTYRHHAVLKSVSLCVEPGTILGLVGRNGAGKSTLLECLLGLQQPDYGQARLFGKFPQSIDDTDKVRLSYVPQRPDGFNWMTVGSMLGLVAGLYPQWDKQLVERLIKEWGLDERRRLLALSPGERQQLAIIRALAPRPRLLVLDEPASALDPLARRALLREIASLANEQNSTVLFSTHIISDLERVASHVALLHQGCIGLYAELDDIKEKLRRVIWPASIPLQENTLPGELSRRLLDNGSWVIILHAKEKVWPSGVSAHPLSLEDLFVELAA